MTRIQSKELQSLVNNSRFNVFRVTWIGDPTKNWLLTKNGVGMAGQSFKTKQRATEKSREIASRKEHRPSVIIFEYKKPGGDKTREAGVQDWQTYR